MYLFSMFAKVIGVGKYDHCNWNHKKIFRKHRYSFVLCYYFVVDKKESHTQPHKGNKNNLNRFFSLNLSYNEIG